MSAPSSPPRRRSRPSRHRPAEANPGLRVSDAERAAAADRLSAHYSDGRLDQAEFDERLDQAMKAKTHSDLTGLFADLPDTQGPDSAAGRRDSQPRRHRVVLLVLVVVITAAVGHVLARSYIPLLLIGLLAFFCLRYRPWRRRL
jgi:Flp pilus assembly protein TadB